MPIDELDTLIRALGGVISTTEARGAGLTQASLKWAVRKGLLKPIRRGVYTSGPMWEQGSLATRHQLMLLAQQRVHPQLVACAGSAAVALHLPLPQGPPEKPRLTIARDERRHGARGHRGEALRRRAYLADDEVLVLPNGLRVTTPLRTVLDCAREWPRPWGLAIADAAISEFRVSPSDLVAAARDRAPAPGTSRSCWVAEHARPQVESPLESLARGIIVLAELPEPTPQVWIGTRAGSYRVDLLDAENRLITEADGKIKYSSPEDLWREKRREDALREAEFEVTRFAMYDYHHYDSWLAAYRRALSRSHSRPG